ncbi:MAG: hypothetical protein HYT41_02575 [Candidatus Sungbacteria bacterium]|nr:hypothetical protein [Candidatus Sungbacteria bacterium]
MAWIGEVTKLLISIASCWIGVGMVYQGGAVFLAQDAAHKPGRGTILMFWIGIIAVMFGMTLLWSTYTALHVEILVCKIARRARRILLDLQQPHVSKPRRMRVAKPAPLTLTQIDQTLTGFAPKSESKIPAKSPGKAVKRNPEWTRLTQAIATMRETANDPHIVRELQSIEEKLAHAPHRHVATARYWHSRAQRIAKTA